VDIGIDLDNDIIDIDNDFEIDIDSKLHLLLFIINAALKIVLLRVLM
jgi:hypothetical protein